LRSFSKNRPARRAAGSASFASLRSSPSSAARVGVVQLRPDPRDRGEIDAGKLDPQKQLDNQVNGYIYDSTGKRILAVLRGSEARTLISYDDIADPMRHAIVAIEDRRFWEHDGIDLRGIGRALVADIRTRRSSRAARRSRSSSSRTRSTRDQKTIARKVREAAYAWQLERSRRLAEEEDPARST
jgi:membrane peptidoglycan carboxypeptidase